MPPSPFSSEGSERFGEAVSLGVPLTCTSTVRERAGGAVARTLSRSAASHWYSPMEKMSV